MRTSIATVCLSGGLADKMRACAAAGFDGVELFEPDLVASEHSPEEVRALADRLGLSLDLYQPLRDVEGVSEEAFVETLRRAEAKFALARRLGVDLVLVCSNVGTATVDSDEVSADQLRRLGVVAAGHGVRLAFEALAWGRFVDDYRRAWRIVELADHPAVGLCLDSFHILSRGHDPRAIEDVPGEKIFFLQMADAPALSMDVLSWSRHHRLFPGEGSFDLATFLAHVLRTGYDGRLSLEVFNDTFRQADVGRTAAHARRSLVWLEDAAARLLDGRAGLTTLPDVAAPTGLDAVEIRAADGADVEAVLGQLGFTFRGRHRTEAVHLWTSGDARVVVDGRSPSDEVPRLAAVGLGVVDPAASARRAHALRAPTVHRRAYASGPDLEAVASPDGTEVFWSDSAPGAESSWVAEFQQGERVEDRPLIGAIDHVNLAQPWHAFDEAVLFHTSVLGLEAEVSTEVAGPYGLIRSQVVRSADGGVRLPLNLAPAGREVEPVQHVAFSCTDVVAVARRARERGMRPLPVPANYYDDLTARYALDEDEVDRLRELDLLYERDGSGGEFVHFYTRVTGQVFWEVVERRGGYDGYGATNASVRLAAQDRANDQRC